MILTRHLVFTLCLFQITITKSFALNLEQAWQKSCKNSLEAPQYLSQIKEIQHKTESIDGAYDGKLKDQISHTQDRKPSQMIRREQSDFSQNELSYEKLFSTGSYFSAKLTNTRTKTDFLDPLVISISDELQIPFDPNVGVVHNPEFQTSLEFSLSQPLWRNWLAKEIDLQKKIASSAAIKPRYDYLLQLQNIQAEVERVFLQYSYLDQQIKLTQKMVDLSKVFRKQMKKNVDFGRADLTNLIAARTKIVELEGQLLDLKLNKDLIYNRLKKRVFPTGQQNPRFVSSHLKKPIKDFRIPKKSSLKDYIIAKRLDLKQLEKIKQASNHRLALLDEQQHSQLDLFISAATHGLNAESGSSFEDASSFDNPTLSIGIKWQKTLGHTAKRQEKQAIYAEVNKYQEQIVHITQKIINEVELAQQEQNITKRLRQQAYEHIKLIEQQIRVEKKRIAQARSDEIAVIQYQMELVGIQSRILRLQLKERQIEAMLRLLSHSYQACEHETIS